MKTSVIIHSRLNEFTPEQLMQVVELAKQFNANIRHVATGLQVYGLEKEEKQALEAALPEGLSPVCHRGVNAVVACRGKEGCSHGFMETIKVAEYVEDTHFGEDLPSKLKVGVSGCPRCCADSLVRDVGLVGMPDGFKLVVGGRSGNRPQAGSTIATGLSVEDAQRAISLLVSWYKEKALPKEKFDHLVERLGNPFENGDLQLHG